MDSYDLQTCPKCHSVNVIAMGDITDSTSSMGELPACICWSCSNKFWRYEDPRDFILELESEGYWDSSKTPEENLEAVDAEKGKPTCDYYSLEYENFLNQHCEIAGKYIKDWSSASLKKCTWRGFLLWKMNSISPINPWILNRKERIEVINNCLKDNNLEDVKEDIAMAFNAQINRQIQYFGLFCQKGTKIDWKCFYASFSSLVKYLFQISE